MGFRRSPAQSGQRTVARPALRDSSASRHLDSSPLCSASNSVICKPVPKQLLHHPWRELKEKSRGSSSGKPVPQVGQARLVEKTALCPASPAPPFALAPPPPACTTCSTPRPCSSATLSASRSSDSRSAFT